MRKENNVVLVSLKKYTQIFDQKKIMWSVGLKKIQKLH